MRVLGRLLALAPSLAVLADLGAREYGLTYSRGRVVAELHRSGPLVMRAIADALGVSPRTVTGLVDALEQDGWVIRRPHPRDRRATIVELTGYATETFGRLEALYRRFASRLLGEIAVRDLEGALVVINGVESGLSEAINTAGAGDFDPDLIEAARKLADRSERAERPVARH